MTFMITHLDVTAPEVPGSRFPKLGLQLLDNPTSDSVEDVNPVCRGRSENPIERETRSKKYVRPTLQQLLAHQVILANPVIPLRVVASLRLRYPLAPDDPESYPWTGDATVLKGCVQVRLVLRACIVNWV